MVQIFKLDLRTNNEYSTCVNLKLFSKSKVKQMLIQLQVQLYNYMRLLNRTFYRYMHESIKPLSRYWYPNEHVTLKLDIQHRFDLCRICSPCLYDSISTDVLSSTSCAYQVIWVRTIICLKIKSQYTMYTVQQTFKRRCIIV